MKTTIAVLLTAVLTASAAMAGAQVNVSANAPAKIYFDDQFVGQAPFSLRNAPPGFHQLRVENQATGENRVYDFYSPKGAAVVKEVTVQFAGGQDQGPPPPDGGMEPPSAVAGDAQQYPAEAASAEREAAERARRAEQQRQKRRLRNTLLGVAVGNELLNKGSSKKTVRGVSLGGALLNELFNR
ncbi:MAG: hypothetical protein HY815_23030 [Candidatus Riflebacteria bacterium]|nr:hypothetical protein [Candidatus Riflebacteria bacterium]